MVTELVSERSDTAFRKLRVGMIARSNYAGRLGQKHGRPMLKHGFRMWTGGVAYSRYSTAAKHGRTIAPTADTRTVLTRLALELSREGGVSGVEEEQK